MVGTLELHRGDQELYGIFGHGNAIDVTRLFADRADTVVIGATKAQLDRMSQKKATKEMAESMSKMIHDYRNLVQSLQFGLEAAILKKDMPREELEKMLKKLLGVTQHLSSLVDGTLEISKYEAGMVTIRRENTSIIKAIEAAEDSLLYMLEENEIEMNLIVTTENPEVFIDEEKILRVFMNLFSNAIKYSNKGGKIDITVENDGEFLSVSVRDYGPGIPPGEEDEIFEMFVQSSASKSGGTGLGLSICREIIEAHDGWIVAANHPEGGAIFQLSIPYTTSISN